MCYNSTGHGMGDVVVSMAKAGLQGGQGVSFSGDRAAATQFVQQIDPSYRDPQAPAAQPQGMTTQVFQRPAQQASGPAPVARPSPVTNSATSFRRDLSIPTASPSNGAGLNIPS